MNKQIASLSRVSKSFRRQKSMLSPLTSKTASNEKKAKQTVHQVLSKVDLRLFQGDRILLLGANGAGKTTLLKLLARVIKPNEGEIFLPAKIAAFLEVGVGFHLELSGKENVFLFGAIIGHKAKELYSLLSSIEEFAELKGLLDLPCKQFSSGMVVRLALAIALISLTPMIILDEVFTTLDASFQKKILQKILEKSKNEGLCTIFVSHEPEKLLPICTRALFLDKSGHLIEGAPMELYKHYLALF